MNFNHDPNYEDVRILNETGYWPNMTIPDWAGERSVHYECSATHPLIIQQAAEFEIKKLTIERNEARYEARILAHAYTTDNRPPNSIVTHALSYDVDQRLYRLEFKFVLPLDKETPDDKKRRAEELKTCPF